MERNTGCSFDHIAYIDEKPAYILHYRPADTTGIFDFENNQSGFYFTFR